jgi:hypothetical protein
MSVWVLESLKFAMSVLFASSRSSYWAHCRTTDTFLELRFWFPLVVVVVLSNHGSSVPVPWFRCLLPFVVFIVRFFRFLFATAVVRPVRRCRLLSSFPSLVCRGSLGSARSSPMRIQSEISERVPISPEPTTSLPLGRCSNFARCPIRRCQVLVGVWVLESLKLAMSVWVLESLKFAMSVLFASSRSSY